MRYKCHWWRHHFLLCSVFLNLPQHLFSWKCSCGGPLSFPDSHQLRSKNGQWHLRLNATRLLTFPFILLLMISFAIWMLSRRQLLLLISKSVLIIRVNLWTVRWGESGLSDEVCPPGFFHVLWSLWEAVDKLNGFISKPPLSWWLSVINVWIRGLCFW